MTHGSPPFGNRPAIEEARTEPTQDYVATSQGKAAVVSGRTMQAWDGGPVAARYDAALIDLDGVVYRGDRSIPGAPEALEAVRRLGIRVVFLTNNSARTPHEVAGRLAAFGVRADPDEILTSALATADLLQREFARQGILEPTAFVVGERGVREALSSAGIAVRDGEPTRADVVVVGWDRTVDYRKLRTAALLVQRGARLVATNPDASYPAPDGLWPGAGALLAAVTTTTGATPTVVGKPHPPLFEAAARAAGTESPLVVGDRLDTDIAGAARMGWDSVLVLTGASTPVELAMSDTLPTYVGRNLSILGQAVPPGRFRPAVPADEQAIDDLLRTSGLSAAGTGEARASTVVLLADHEPAGSPGRPRRGLGRHRLLATATVEDLDGQGYLRSVAVSPEVRGRGVGMLTVAAALRLARMQSLRRVSVFTENAAPFFEQMGFHRVGRGDLPESILASRQVAECAASAVPMVIEL